MLTHFSRPLLYKRRGRSGGATKREEVVPTDSQFLQAQGLLTSFVLAHSTLYRNPPMTARVSPLFSAEKRRGIVPLLLVPIQESSRPPYLVHLQLRHHQAVIDPLAPQQFVEMCIRDRSHPLSLDFPYYYKLPSLHVQGFLCIRNNHELKISPIAQ